jgi:hypothetical protein
MYKILSKSIIMKAKFVSFVSSCILIAIGAKAKNSDTTIFTFNHNEALQISHPTITKSVVLNYQQIPKKIVLKNALYQSVQKGIVPIDSNFSIKNNELNFEIAFEKKRPVAIVDIPLFKKNEKGEWTTLKSYQLEVITERVESKKQNANYKTTASSSILSSGNWAKIAIQEKGIYKIDHNFLTSQLGYKLPIPSNQIRLFGNGGTVIPEANSSPTFDDLIENNIFIHDGGDGQINEGDYILFYANGPIATIPNTSSKIFTHQNNYYSDKSYYFISIDAGIAEQRVLVTDATSSTANQVATSFNQYVIRDIDQVNLGKFGKTWFETAFTFGGNNVSTNNFNPLESYTGITPNAILAEDSVHIACDLASVAIGDFRASNFTGKLNNNEIFNIMMFGVPGTDGNNPASLASRANKYAINKNEGINLSIQFTKNVSVATGYIDYLMFNFRQQLNFFNKKQISFRDFNSIGAGNITRFEISNSDPSTIVWDVTNPLRPFALKGNLESNTYKINVPTDSLREFIAFQNSNFLTPEFVEQVPNQDLHGLGQFDYIIIAHPEMMNAANTLAEFHRNNYGTSVITANTNQIYNEFGSGTPDISAIRNFIKMFYDRASFDESQMPKNVLLLGQGSYDYKNILPALANAKTVPTYETDESIMYTESYATDDFYSFLDDNETISSGRPLMDIGVGRIPATSESQAMDIVNKIIRYKSNMSLGPWRLNNIYMADVEDNAGTHMLDADSMYKTVQSANDIYGAQKVYLDNMKIISTPGGARSPEANKIINDNVYRGAFLMNYSGHGSIYALSSKRIVTQTDYNNWNNQYRLPLLITATCDFSRFDNPGQQSSGEKIILKANGGAIALVTTTQVVYAGPNLLFNKAYLETQFTKEDNSYHSFGQAFRNAKNKVLSAPGSNVTNSRKFALLGDPAITPNFPKFNISTDSILKYEQEIYSRTDTIKSLGQYKLMGSIRDFNEQVMTEFNGKAYVTIYDKSKMHNIKTARSGSGTHDYTTQNNTLYTGIATVTNGLFEAEFITPKDIDYDFGAGKITIYAENGSTDAAGIYQKFTVGGFVTDAEEDHDAPIVRPYMNDSLFIDGGLTGSNSLIYAILSDKNGINVSGNSVGHDITAILDDDVANPYILNDYYQTFPNTYQKGFVSFPVKGLSDGFHTLKVKAWDVYNNSGEGTIGFEVLGGDVVKIRTIFNYPNPFTQQTTFVFEHNHPLEAIDATINIYNSMGSLVKTIKQTFTASGSRSHEITWDGTGNGGELLSAGVYIAHIQIGTEKNITDIGYQKVQIIR